LRARSCATGYAEPRVAQSVATICAASFVKGCGQSLQARRLDASLRARSCATGYAEPRVAQSAATICVASFAKGCGQSLQARRLDAQRQVRSRRSASVTWVSARTPERVRRGPGSWGITRRRPVRFSDDGRKRTNLQNLGRAYSGRKCRSHLLDTHAPRVRQDAARKREPNRL
jgi:hypothetical protein